MSPDAVAIQSPPRTLSYVVAILEAGNSAGSNGKDFLIRSIRDSISKLKSVRDIMNKKASLISFALLASAGAYAQVVQYAAPGGSFDPTTVANRVSATALSDVGSAADLQAGVGLPNSVFLQQNVLSTNAAQAVSNNQWFEFTVAPQIGFHLNLASLSFDASRGGSSTPRGWVLRSSRDGFSTDLGTADVPTQNPTYSPFNVTLTGLVFQNILSETTFRIYGYGPSTAVGMFYDNITLQGAVVEDPILVKYSADGSSFLPTNLGDNILASELNDLGSAADLQQGVALPNSVFLQQNVLSTNAAQAVLNDQFFQFSIAAIEGMRMDISSITFDAARGGASTPRGWVVRSSLDGFATDLGTSDVAGVNPNLSGFGIDLSGTSLFQNVTSQVTFRIYGYGPSTGIGMFYDDIAVHGSVEAVPEPATLAVLGCGALALLRRRRVRA